MLLTVTVAIKFFLIGVLVNHPIFPTITLGEILNNSFNPELLKERIVLIGNTALSSKDFFKNSL